MAGNDKNMVRDGGNLIAPQYYNPITDQYEYAQGANGAIFTQLTGRNVEVVKLLDALAITSPVSASTNWVQNKYRSWELIVKNTLDVPVRLLVETGDGNGNSIISMVRLSDNTYLPYRVDGSNWWHQAPQGYTEWFKLRDIPKDLAKLPADLDFYKTSGAQIKVTYRTTTAATSGALSIYLLGVPL